MTGRAPDYDDWQLNGDIMVDYPLLGTCIELSSMGVRVDAATLAAQLEERGLSRTGAAAFSTGFAGR